MTCTARISTGCQNPDCKYNRPTITPNIFIKNENTTIAANELEYIIKRPDELTEVKYLNYPIILEGGSNILFYGLPESGRTWSALSVGYQVALGTELFERWDAPSPSNVLYICGDTPHAVLAQKVRKVTNSFSNNANEISDKFNYLSMKHTPTELLDGSNDQMIDELLLSKTGPQGNCLLIIDSLRSLTDFENQEKYWKKLTSWLRELNSKGCSVLLIHDECSQTGTYRHCFDSIIHITKNGNPPVLNLSIDIEKSPTLLNPLINAIIQSRKQY